MIIDSEKYFIHSNGWWWGCSYFIARRDGSGIVEVVFDRSMPETMYIESLSVLESERRRGIGRSLLELCEEIAFQEGKVFLSLSVEFGKDWLLAWYKRFGFRIYRVEENTFTMIKELKK